MVANEETWVRGVVLSFASALLQALVAVVVVGIAAALLNATAATMRTRGRSHRNPELFAHHSHRRQVAVGEGARVPHHVADAASSRRGRRRGNTGASPSRSWHHDDHDHAHDHASCSRHMATIMIIISTARSRARSRSRRPCVGLGTCACAGARGARRPRRMEAGALRHRRRRLASLLRRHPGVGVRAGAGPVLDRRRFHLHHGARHRHHRRRHRHHRRLCQGLGQARRRYAVRLRHAGDARHRGRCRRGDHRLRRRSCSPATWSASGWWDFGGRVFKIPITRSEGR